MIKSLKNKLKIEINPGLKIEKLRRYTYSVVPYLLTTDMSELAEGTDVSKLKITADTVEKEIISKKRSKRRRSSNKLKEPLTRGTPVLKKEKKRKSLLPPTLELKSTNRLRKFHELRELSLFLLQVNDTTAPQFADINNRHLVKHVVLLIVPGLDAADFGVNWELPVLDNVKLRECPEELPFIKEHFSKVMLTSAPGDSNSLYPLIKAFNFIPYSKKQKQQKVKELESKKLFIPDLLMTLPEFLDNEYPIHPLIPGIRENEKTEAPEGWVDTISFEHKGSHTFSIDCEMCESEKGKVLTRVSLINFDEEVLLDELVKPADPITNYLTQYSGITEEALEDVVTTLEDIQKKILDIISADDVLIGHSIENDLNVLKLRHPKIIDTSLIFEHPRGPPFKSSLKYLTLNYLDRTIQDGSHDSIIDAKACLDLVKAKIAGNALLGKVVDGQSIFRVMSDCNKSAVVIDYQKVQNDDKKYLKCSDDDEITERLIEKANDTDLVVAKFKEIEESLKCKDIESNGDDKLSKKEVLTNLNRRLERIYSQIPGNTVFILSSGHGDATKVFSLGGQKRAFKKEYQNKLYSEIESGWDHNNEAELKVALKKARLGLAFMSLKFGDQLAVESQEVSQDTQEDNEHAIIEE